MLADVVIKILKPRAIELTNLLKAFFQLNQLELWEVLMQVLGYGLPGGFEDGVPVVSIEVARKRDFVHDEGVLHLLLLYLMEQSTDG